MAACFRIVSQSPSPGSTATNFFFRTSTGHKFCRRWAPCRPSLARSGKQQPCVRTVRAQRDGMQRQELTMLDINRNPFAAHVAAEVSRNVRHFCRARSDIKGQIHKDISSAYQCRTPSCGSQNRKQSARCMVVVKNSCWQLRNTQFANPYFNVDVFR